MFKISFDVVNDVMRNKILEEMLETGQEMVRRMMNCIKNLSRPPPEPSYLEKIFIYLKTKLLSMFREEVKKRRLWSDLVKNLSKCEFS